MKLKKFFAVLSAVSMLASVAAVNANAEDVPGADPASRPYSFDYSFTADGAVIKNVTAASGISEIELPEATPAGVPVVGVEDFAFINCDDVNTIVIPESYTLDSIGDVAFLTADDIGAFLADNGIPDEVLYADDEETLLGAIDATTAAYTANTVKFMGKNNWKGTEEELEPARTVFSNVAKTVGGKTAGEFVQKLYTLEDTSAVVRADDEDTLEKMSEKSYELFRAWVKTIKYVDLTIKGAEDSDAAKFAAGKALLGVKFVAAENHLVGDANQDGVVNVRDCAKIANALAFKTVDQLCLKCADYNQDGEVTVRDAAQLAASLAKKK